MRDFYRTYENHPNLMSYAMQLGWIHNVVIMEADLTMELREWYMKAAKQFAWSKTELIDQIAANAHENIVLAVEEELCCVTKQEEEHDGIKMKINSKSRNESNQNIHSLRKLWLIWKEGRRRCDRLIGRNLLKVSVFSLSVTDTCLGLAIPILFHLEHRLEQKNIRGIPDTYFFDANQSIFST